MGHEINGSVRNGKLTQFDASWGSSPANCEGQSESSMKI